MDVVTRSHFVVVGPHFMFACLASHHHLRLTMRYVTMAMVGLLISIVLFVAHFCCVVLCRILLCVCVCVLCFVTTNSFRSTHIVSFLHLFVYSYKIDLPLIKQKLANK